MVNGKLFWNNDGETLVCVDAVLTLVFIVLFCFVLFCFVLFCFVLFCFVLYSYVLVLNIKFYFASWQKQEIRESQMCGQRKYREPRALPWSTTHRTSTATLRTCGSLLFEVPALASIFSSKIASVLSPHLSSSPRPSCQTSILFSFGQGFNKIKIS